MKRQKAVPSSGFLAGLWRACVRKNWHKRRDGLRLDYVATFVESSGDLSSGFNIQAVNMSNFPFAGVAIIALAGATVMGQLMPGLTARSYPLAGCLTLLGLCLVF